MRNNIVISEYEHLYKKRHLMVYNFSMAEDAYYETEEHKKHGTTIKLLAAEILEFARTARKVVLQIEQQM